MKISVMKDSGAAGSDIDVSDDIFGASFNESLIHQLVVAHLAGARQGTRGQKNRAAVKGGGIKPWRQKGTGRARAGTSRSPIWRGGGKTFPAVTADFAQKLNKKMRRAGMRSILSELLRQGRLVAVDSFTVDAPKTKNLVEKLGKFEATDVLIVTANDDINLMLSARNLHGIEVCQASAIDPVSLVGHEKVIMTTDALKHCAEVLA